MMKAALCVATVLLLSVFMSAQGPSAPSAYVSEAQVNAPSSELHATHKFWDRENAILFGLHAGLEAADFGLTHYALAHGSVERNPLARPFTNLGTAGQAAFFAGGTAATLGITYWLHKRGHHRLERMIGMYAIGDSGFGVIHNATHPPQTAVRPIRTR
jgi:hypothetical protein